MGHRYYKEYTFCIGSEIHDNETIYRIEAHTKAEAMRKARGYKVFPTDRIKFYGAKVIAYWYNGGWVWSR